jgi:predicted AlkP superfamily phosphohydrolase/phosphomutase
MIVVGVDGANVETLVRPARRDALANVGSLLADGVGGTLWSQTTSSAAAWTCHLTGVSPKASGVTGFTTADGDRFVRTSDIKVRTYPELLSEAGLDVGLLNIPLTYPPLDLNGGFCVTGQITPLDAEDYARPEEVQPLLDDMDYEVDIQYGDRQYAFVDDDLGLDREQVREDVLRVEHKRVVATERLAEEREWDVLFVLINGTDPLQHYYWHEMDDARMEETALYDIYSLVDDLVGTLRDRYPEENVLMFSDHGFRRDVWGSNEGSRQRWQRVRGYASRLFPDGLRETKLRGAGLGLLARVASLTTETAGEDEWQHTGGHDPAGVWVLGGPDVEGRDGDVEAQFLDLPATILHLLDQPVPERYEGTVRTDVLTDSDEPDRTDIDLSVRRRQVIDDDMREQLAHLGYVEMVEE